MKRIGLALLLATTLMEEAEADVVAEVGVLVGGPVRSVPLRAVPGGSSEGVAGPVKLSVIVGVERPHGRWILGAAGHASLSGDPELAALGRATFSWNRCWSLRLGVGPLVTCKRCRGIFQDTGVVARAGVGHRSGISLDFEARALAFDLGSDIRPIGTELTIFGGLTFTGIGRRRPAGGGWAFEASVGYGYAYREGVFAGNGVSSVDYVGGVGLGRRLTPALVLTARVSGSPQALYEDGIERGVKVAFIGPSLQYWLRDTMSVAGGVGVARAVFNPLGEGGPASSLGIAANVRAGYGVKLDRDNRLTMALEMTVANEAQADRRRHFALGLHVGHQY